MFNEELLNYDYPICDTDIWVNLCLGNIDEELFKKYKRVFFVSVVRDEILKWSNNATTAYIAERFRAAIKEKKAIIIDINQLDEFDRKIIEKQLVEDAGFINGFKTSKNESKNLGEYVSAIVADYFGIIFMKSNDHLFNDGEKGAELYPDLEVRNWQRTTVDLVPDLKMRTRIIRQVESENQKMNKAKYQYKHGEATLEDIQKLREKFNSK